MSSQFTLSSAAPTNGCGEKDEEDEKNVHTHALSDIPRFMAFANSCWNRPEMRVTLKMCPISSQLRTWVSILNDSQKITKCHIHFQMTYVKIDPNIIQSNWHRTVKIGSRRSIENSFLALNINSAKTNPYCKRKIHIETPAWLTFVCCGCEVKAQS